MNARKKGVMSNLPNNRGIGVLAFLLFIAILAFVANMYVVDRDSGYDAKYLEITADLRFLSQQIATSSRQATDGKATAFDRLANARGRFSRAFTNLSKGSVGLPSPRPLLNEELDALAADWDRVNKAAGIIVENKERILFLHDVAKTLNDSIPVLQEDYNSVVNSLLANRAPAGQVALAQKQAWLAERIARNIDKMLVGEADATEAAEQFNLDAKTFGRVLTGMLNGDNNQGISRVTDATARKSLAKIAKSFEFVSSSVDEIFQASPDLLNVRQAADRILIDAPKMMTATGNLAEQIGKLGDERQFTEKTAYACGIAILVVLFLIGMQIYRNTRKTLVVTEQGNQQKEEAILRLLDELDNLADGDLTTTATVGEDFTGAIADSINYTIDQLRILVSSINETALSVSSAADETQATALHLAEASEHQAQEIVAASGAINEMAATIDQVSSNATESASVAERSVSIANTGAEVVQNTIHGMDTIREQIQETSKRIKRLGESSQEIGDIVSLINDIADQTNILALNAAIQASMAGEAGRGFAVVADEVQRLAERSGAATKQIEALVKTIQSDTNEAVISMEQTTAEVVRGAQLAQDAGVALEEIEKVSSDLAELIQNISNAARQQASSAGHISNTMNVIQEITSQTSAGTTAAAQSIGNLAAMTNDLRNSVAGFKLPNDNGSARASS
jgi:twitching motility protein PilJ